MRLRDGNCARPLRRRLLRLRRRRHVRDGRARGSGAGSSASTAAARCGSPTASAIRRDAAGSSSRVGIVRRCTPATRTSTRYRTITSSRSASTLKFPLGSPFGGTHVEMKLVVNGKSIEVDVPADTPLLWVLREELGLTGTKFGCGKALCGACTVHVDGKPRRSCVTRGRRRRGHSRSRRSRASPTGDGAAPGAAGVDRGERPAVRVLPVRPDHVGGRAARGAKPAPTDDDIDAVMSANLCRCGTYPRIRRAIVRAAARRRRGGTP